MWFTALDKGGHVVPPFDRWVFRGALFGNGLVDTPTFPHTVRREVPSCKECHADPKRMGLGSGVGHWERGDFLPVSPSVRDGQGNRYLLEPLVTPEGTPLQGTSHEGARPFNKEELRRIFRVNACLVCHENGKDPIFVDFERSLRLADTGKHRQEERRFLQGSLSMHYPAPRITQGPVNPERIRRTRHPKEERP